MSDLAEKFAMTRAASYQGLGRNPNSNIKEAETYRGLGRNPNSNLGTAPSDRPLQRNTRTHEELPKPIAPFTERAEATDEATFRYFGSFFGIYKKTEGANAGDTYLQGGSVVGANGGSATIADIKVVDKDTGPVGGNGQILYVKVNCRGVVVNGVMLPGCTLLSAVTGVGSSLPDNDAFTVSNITGDLYEEIGRWNEVEFLPSSAGTIYAHGCIGDFYLNRNH